MNTLLIKNEFENSLKMTGNKEILRHWNNLLNYNDGNGSIALFIQVIKI